jgi:hypothetical protein
MLPELTQGERFSRRWMALSWMIGVTCVSALSLALKKPTLAPYPGVVGDPVMLVLAFTAVYGCVVLVFKFLAVASLGPWLERRLRGNLRKVRLRDVWHPSIRKTAFWGGSLQAFNQMLLIALVNAVSPAGISAAKACIIIPLALMELMVRQMKPEGLGWWVRLLGSMALTLYGAGIVIFEGGFKLFSSDSRWALIALVVFVTLGNGMVAYAEVQEFRGVHAREVAAPVYSLARIVVYCATCVTVALLWAIVNGGWLVAWNVVLMCVDRWELVLPIALLGAISDTSRICVKTIITATHMYTMLAMAVAADVALQTWFKKLEPEIYDNIRPGSEQLLVAGIGAMILIVGILIHPRPSKKHLINEQLAIA